MDICEALNIPEEIYVYLIIKNKKNRLNVMNKGKSKVYTSICNVYVWVLDIVATSERQPEAIRGAAS